MLVGLTWRLVCCLVLLICGLRNWTLSYGSSYGFLKRNMVDIIRYLDGIIITKGSEFFFMDDTDTGQDSGFDAELATVSAMQVSPR